MKYDCGFINGNGWFRYRAGGIIVHNNKILFIKSKIGGYYYMLGGGVHLGETSKDCVEREVFEETGMRAKVNRLGLVCENFFKSRGDVIDEMECHTIEFYYLMNVDDEQYKLCRKQADNDEQLVWIDIADVANSYIKPKFITERIFEILESKNIIHITEERDR